MTEIIFKELDKEIIIRDFDCGDLEINSFLEKLAHTNQEEKLSKTYTFCIKDTNELIAFMTLSASQLNTGDARIFGIDKVPVVLLGRLGVDNDFKGKGLGFSLIRIALEKALDASYIIACRLLLVETTSDMKSYYLEKVNMGFEWFRDRKKSSILFIDLKKYEKSIQ